MVIADYPGAYKLEVHGTKVKLVLETEDLEVYQTYQLASDLYRAGHLANRAGDDQSKKT